MSSLWVEKYRPQSFDEIVGNTEAVDCLRKMAREQFLFHILLCGEPGSGKTSAIKCLARALLREHYGKTVLELNAADDRGIDVVRAKIKSFAQEKVALPGGLPKIVILDEVEAMTEGAQQTLRRIFELYSHTTRFALACNNADKVIEPLQSRCVKLNVRRIESTEMVALLARICEREQFPFEADALALLASSAQGDCRKAIGLLQTCATCFDRLTETNASLVCDLPPATAVAQLLQHLLAQNFFAAHSAFDALTQLGYQPFYVMTSLKRAIDASSLPATTQTNLHKLISYLLVQNEYALTGLSVE